MNEIRVTRQMLQTEITKIEQELVTKYDDNAEQMFMSLLNGIALYNIATKDIELPKVTVDYDVFEKPTQNNPVVS